MTTMIDLASLQTITVAGQEFVLVPKREFLRLAGEPPEPELPPAAEDGNYPAMETMRAIMGRDMIRARRALGWSQAELARRAGVPAETLNRIERATRSPSLATFDKLHRALERGEAEATRTSRSTTTKRKTRK
ncbi:MAG: helix-turn-helix domain-containing protein [Pirellulales bacterium]